jgi:hypothetical protein
MINNQKEEREMMKFEKTAEFGSHTVFSSTNHADPQKAADIVQEHDLGTFVGQIVWMEHEGEDSVFETIGEFDTFDQAKRALECEVTMSVKI